MRPSDIFDAYAKLAQEQGLISIGEKDKSKEEISNIEILYGIKPEMIKGMEYDSNIMESAHKDSVIVNRSYDRMNSLVENNNQQQTVNLNIADKTPTGQLSNFKYAHNQLMLSLIRTANYLDNQDHELRVLADVCLDQMSFKKTALAPLAIGAVTSAAALLGILYANQHLPATNQGYERNYQRLDKEISDLLTASSSFGVGYTTDDSLKKDMNSFKSKLSNFNTLYQKVKPIFSNLETPRSGSELSTLANQSNTENIIKAYETFKTAAEDLYPFIKRVSDNFSSQTYKERHITDKGALTSLVDYVGLHGGKGLIADDFDDVVSAIPPYLDAINEILTVLKSAENFTNHAKKTLEDATASNPFKDKPVPSTESKLSQTTNNNSNAKFDINNPDALEQELKLGI